MLIESPHKQPPGLTEAQSIASQPPSAPSKHLRYKLALGVAAACAGIIAAGLFGWRYKQAKAAPEFQVVRVERGPIAVTVSATGTCNAVVSVQVGSQVSGNIKALFADFNTVVRAGQLVALIDPQMFQAKVDQTDAAWKSSKASLENARAANAKSEADFYGARASEKNQLAVIAKAKVAVADAKAKLDRRVQMYNGQILAKEDLDTAQAAYDEALADLNSAEAQHDSSLYNVQSAEAALHASQTQVAMFEAQVELNLASLKQAHIDLAHTRIVSPVDGTVVARQMDVGQTVAASFQAPTIFQIAQDLTKMQIDTNVDESDVGRLKVGQHATFTVDAFPDMVFRGPIVQIRKAPINIQNVITYDAVVQADNPELKLFPGMTANVRVVTQSKDNVLKVPNAAVRFRPGAKPQNRSAQPSKPLATVGNWRIVYVQGSDSQPHPVKVRLGITDGTSTEIEQGDLREGDQVITGAKSKAPASTAPSPSMPRRI